MDELIHPVYTLEISSVADNSYSNTKQRERLFTVKWSSGVKLNIKNCVFWGVKCTWNAWDLVLISMSLACMHNILSYEVLRSSSAWLLTFFNKENISFLNNGSIKFNYFILLRIEIKIIVVKVWNDIFKFNRHFQQNMLSLSTLPVVGEKQ